MSNYSTILERITNRAFVDRKVAQTAFDVTPVMKALYDRKKITTGTQMEKVVSKGDLKTAVNFSIFGTNDSTSPDEPDNKGNVVQDFKFTGDTIKLSDLKTAQTNGAERIIAYVESEVDEKMQSFKQKMARNIKGDGSAAVDWSGFDDIFTLTGTYGGLTRADFPSLIPNVFDARDTASGHADGTVAVTNGSVDVTGTTTGWTAAIVYPGGTITIGGVDYTVAERVSDTALKLTTRYQGTTDTGVAYVYNGQFADTISFGASGVFTLRKLNKPYYTATDGNDIPKFMWCNNMTFEAIQANLIQNQRYTGESQELGVKGYENFKYNGGTMTVDNLYEKGTIHGVNLDYVELCLLKGWSDFKLHGGLMPVPPTSGQNFATKVGQMVIGGNMVAWGMNRFFKISGFTI